MEKIKKTKTRDWKTLFVMMGIAAVCFIIGMQVFPTLFQFVIPHVEGVVVVGTEVSVMFKLSLLMGFAFAIIPFAINSGIKLLKIDSTGLKAFFAVVLLCGPIAALIMRNYMLAKLAGEVYVPGVFSSINVGQVKAAEAVMIGTLAGWVFAMAMFYFFMNRATKESSPKTR
jgi:hypothetical protein